MALVKVIMVISTLRIKTMKSICQMDVNSNAVCATRKTQLQLNRTSTRGQWHWAIGRLG